MGKTPRHAVGLVSPHAPISLRSLRSLWPNPLPFVPTALRLPVVAALPTAPRAPTAGLQSVASLVPTVLRWDASRGRPARKTGRHIANHPQSLTAQQNLPLGRPLSAGQGSIAPLRFAQRRTVTPRSRDAEATPWCYQNAATPSAHANEAQHTTNATHPRKRSFLDGARSGGHAPIRKHLPLRLWPVS